MTCLCYAGVCKRLLFRRVVVKVRRMEEGRESFRLDFKNAHTPNVGEKYFFLIADLNRFRVCCGP